MSTASEAAHLEAAMEAAAAGEGGGGGMEMAMMEDVELPPLGGAEPNPPPPAAAAAPPAAAAAAPVSFYAVRPPMADGTDPTSITSWAIFPSRPAADAYAATLACASADPQHDGDHDDTLEPVVDADIKGFGDAMSAMVYASRGTAGVQSLVGGGKKRKKKRKKRDRDGSGGGSSTAVYAAAKTGNSSDTKRRKPYKQWETSYQRVVALKEKTGGFAINPEAALPSGILDDDEDEAEETAGEDGITPSKKPKRNGADKLRRWMADQRAEYKQYQLGQKSSMTEEKIARLQRIDFDWDTAPLPIGRPRVRDEDMAADSAAAAGDGAGGFNRAPRGTLTEDDKRKAKHMRKRPPKPLTPAKKADWDRLHGLYQAFREENGHGNVNTTEKNELAKWVSKQRYEYKLLKEDKHSLLTTSQLMKLQDADFNFAPRGSSYMSWSERIDMLRAWKDANGHLKIPVNDPELGSFVKAQREAHRRRMIGDTTAMTDERYNDLLELGFVFEAGKRHTAPRGPTKTWEERFQDLMAYRDEYGHCSVPQHYPGLGYWVHAQRNGYRMLREGKKTAMTAEKALKLADASFIFDAKKGKRARASEGGGHGGDHHAGAGGGGGNMMNAAAGMAMGAAHGHHHANPPPLGGHLAPHQWAGHHY